jgi:hypothetical protein
MNDKLHKLAEEERNAKLRRHQAQCSVCRHPQCQAIEEAWIDWAALPCWLTTMTSAVTLSIVI